MDYLNGIKMRILDKDIVSIVDNIESKYNVANVKSSLYNSLDLDYDFGFEKICLSLLTQATSSPEIRTTCDDHSNKAINITSVDTMTPDENASDFQTPEISENPVKNQKIDTSTSVNSNISLSSTIYKTIHNLLKPIPTYINTFKSSSNTNLLTLNSSITLSTSLCNTQNNLVNSNEQYDKSNESKPVVPPNYTDFEDFITQSSSPFDDVELQTVNDMEELKNILQIHPKNYNVHAANQTKNTTCSTSDTHTDHNFNQQIKQSNFPAAYTYSSRPELSMSSTSVCRSNNVTYVPSTSFRVEKTPTNNSSINTYSIPITKYNPAQSLDHYTNLSNSYPLQTLLPLSKLQPAFQTPASTFKNTGESLNSKTNFIRPPYLNSTNQNDFNSDKLQNLTLNDSHNVSRDLEFLMARTTHKRTKAHSPAPPILATRLKSSKSLSNLAAQEDAVEPKDTSQEYHHHHDKERQQTNISKEEYRPSVVKLLPRPLPQTIATKSKGVRKHNHKHSTTPSSTLNYALSPTLLRKRREELLAVVVSMGFEARYAAKAVEHIGTPVNSPHTQLDPKPIIDHLCSVNSLYEHATTHSKADCQAALFLNEMDESKARAFLNGLDRLMALGFPVLEIERALLRNDNHVDRALESLLSNSRATLP